MTVLTSRTSGISRTAKWNSASRRKERQSVPLSMDFAMDADGSRLTVSDGTQAVTVSGPAPEPAWVKTAASRPGGAAPVADALFDMAEEGEPLVSPDIVTDYPRKFAIADSIREKFLARLRSELPHELGIIIRKIGESSGRWDVAADILVNRASQKPIVIGKGAEVVKYARKCAERELSEMYGVKVRLELLVKVEPNWMKNKRFLSEMGFE